MTDFEDEVQLYATAEVCLDPSFTPELCKRYLELREMHEAQRIKLHELGFENGLMQETLKSIRDIQKPEIDDATQWRITSEQQTEMADDVLAKIGNEKLHTLEKGGE